MITARAWARAVTAILALLLVVGTFPSLAAAAGDGDVTVTIPVSDERVTVTITSNAPPGDVAPQRGATANPDVAPVVTSATSPQTPTPTRQAPQAETEASPAPVDQPQNPPAPTATARTDTSPVAGSPSPTPSVTEQPATAAASQPAAPVTAAPASEAQAPRPPPDRVTQWTDSAGTSSTYHLFTSTVTGPVKGLVVYLDGDGMHALSDDGLRGYALGGSSGIVASAGSRGYVTLAIRTPNSDGTFYSNGSGPRNAAYVAGLVEQIRAELGVTSTWLIGYSGGSQLITKWLLPGHASIFPQGGAIITGGGGVQGGQSPQVVPGFALHWETGADDDGRDSSDRYDAIGDALAGSAAYARLGATWVTLATPAGLAHRGMPTRLGGVLASRLDAMSPQQVTVPSAEPAAAPPANPAAAPAPSTDPARTEARAATAASNASGKPWLSGVFANDTATVERWQQVTGQKASVLSVFPTRGSWASQMSPWWLDTAPPGFEGTITVGIPLWPADGDISTAAAGGYNAQWREFAKLVASKYPDAFIRIAWEFNLESWPWAATEENADLWIAAWRHAALSMREVAPQLRFDWNPNEGPTSGLQDATRVYPGDDVVDVIGIDSYDWDPPATSEAAWQTHLTHQGGLNHWVAFARQHGKPISFPEWGVVTYSGKGGGGDNPLYIRKMIEFMYEHADMMAYDAYFEEPENEYIDSALSVNAPKAGAEYKAVSERLRAALPAPSLPAPAWSPSAQEDGESR